jgi:S1-C subfamily serine protease
LSDSNEATQWLQSSDAQVARAAPLLAAIRLASGASLTGLLWQPDIVVTADSPLPPQEAYAVKVASGETLAARVLQRDLGQGVVALGLVGSGPSAPIAQAARPAVGAVLMVLAADANAAPTGQLAVVSGVRPYGRSSQLRVFLDASPGFLASGGPVIDDKGAVIGICVGGPNQPPSIVPCAVIADFLRERPPVKDAIMRRGWIGAALQPISLSDSLRRVAGQATGRLVIGLKPNAPAAEAGILPGDILLSLDGQRMNRAGSLRSLLGPERIGREVEVRLARHGQIRTCRLIIAEQPDS